MALKDQLARQVALAPLDLLALRDRLVALVQHQLFPVQLALPDRKALKVLQVQLARLVLRVLLAHKV